MSAIDVARIAALGDTALPPGTKGLPLRPSLTLREFGTSGRSVLSGDLPMPIAVLRRRELASNVAAMQSFCDQHDALFAPHGKTTMAPQLFAMQLDAGAWALTAATPTHLRQYREFGISRICYANQLVEPDVIDWLAGELIADDQFECYSLVDSVESVAALDRALTASDSPRAINVLIEVGHRDGRCGVRDLATAQRVADAVDAAATLRLVGVECFEGLLPATVADTGPVDEFLRAVADIAVDLMTTTSLRTASKVLFSAGGSLWFDRVLDVVASTDWPVPPQVVLRSGCYVTQDGGLYAQGSPLAGRREGDPLLHNALEVWSTVASRPEPGLVITSMGRRDCSFDAGLPIPSKTARRGGGVESVCGATVLSLSDQHAHVSVPPDSPLGVGDLLCCKVSHPCGTLDKWRVLPVVDDEYRIVDAVATFF